MGKDQEAVPEKCMHSRSIWNWSGFESLFRMRSSRRAFRTNQVKGVIDRMNYLIRKHLSAGRRVQFGEFGNFRYGVGSIKRRRTKISVRDDQDSAYRVQPGSLLRKQNRMQLNDILRLSDYRFIGVGRDDGKDAGEHCAIFYRSDRFKVLDQGDFWLSEHPEKPGRGWDGTCCNRICTWGKFEDLKNHKQFYFFNVHYEYEGDVARRESSNLMISRIKSIAGNQPVFLTGDFNAFPTEEPIRILNDSGFLNDSYKITKEAPFGPVCTYHGYDSTIKTEERLDYIWVTDSIQIDKYGVLTNTLYGHTPSDHFPVMVVAEF